MSGSALIFEKDFSTRSGDTSLDSFDEIRNIPFSGMQRTSGGIGLALPWNIFLLKTPSLADFSMECRMAKGIDPKDGDRFLLYFHYDEKTNTSGILDLTTCNHSRTGRIGVLKDHKTVYSDGQEIRWNDADPLDWSFSCEGRTCTFAGQRFSVPEGVPPAGRIGFSSVIYNRKFEFLILQKIKVRSAPQDYHTVFPRRTWEFPKDIFDSMSSWRFSAEAVSCDDRTALFRAGIEGGPVDLPNHQTFYTKHLGNEYIENPYFRIVLPDGTTEPKQYIYYGKIGFHEHWATVQPAIPAADTECPVKQNFYLDRIPEGSRIIIGFEKMRSEDRQYLSECGREMIADPFTGKLLGARKRDHGEFRITVESGPDKEICRRIPGNISGYDRAYSFAVNNHFFFEGEACAFRICGEFPSDLCMPREISLRISLENVFREVIDLPFDCQRGMGDPVFPGMTIIQYSCDFGILPCGVYHIHTELRMNDEILAEERTAFECMSRKENALSAPELSGLPVIFSAQNDFESGANPFDPRGEGSCNCAHYTAVSGLQILFAEERREWEILKLYGRRLFSWYLTRSTPDPDVLHHLDSARNSAYVAGQDLNWRFHANDLYSYTPAYRKILGEFLQEKGEISMAAEALDPEKPLTLEFLEKLLSGYGNEWPLYNAARHVPERDEIIRKWTEAGIDPASFCNYSFAPYYVTHTGVAFTALRYGRDLRNREYPDYSAFSLAEDYPQLCSYPMICGCFTIANVKLDLPDMRLWPEVYGISGIPLDLATLPNHLPSGAMKSEIYAKRFYDVKTRACWFRDGAFHFWKDDGFHFRNPSETDFRHLLDAWRIIRKWTPVKPLRSMAVVGGADCILKHKPVAEIKEFALTGDFLDFYNTAEDFPAFVCLSTRLSGLPNGFTVRACEIGKLKPEEVSTLVLPPMDCFTEEEKTAVRRLYDAGVNLFCAELADGLEDLFGVEKREPHPVTEIGNEKTNAKYDPVLWKPLAGTETLLTDRDGVPLLTLKKGRSGAYAALFTFAPTAFLRRKVTASEASSHILADAIDKVIRRMEEENAEVTVSKGRINAFRDVSGDLVIIAVEDAHPLPKKTITPLLTVKGDYRQCTIESDARFSVVSQDEEKTLIRLHLAPDEARYFRLKRTIP